MRPTIVWIYEERTFAILVNLGAYVSRVTYTLGGIDYDIILENDEFEIWEDGHAYDEEN